MQQVRSTLPSTTTNPLRIHCCATATGRRHAASIEDYIKTTQVRRMLQGLHVTLLLLGGWRHVSGDSLDRSASLYMCHHVQRRPVSKAVLWACEGMLPLCGCCQLPTHWDSLRLELLLHMHVPRWRRATDALWSPTLPICTWGYDNYHDYSLVTAAVSCGMPHSNL